MPKVTDITRQKRNQDRVNLYIDNQFFMGVSLYIVEKFGLTIGEEVDTETLRDACIEEDLEKAKEYYLKYLIDKPEKVVRDKLRMKEYDEIIVDKLVDFAKKYNFINDLGYAKRFVHDYFLLKGYGINYIKMKLYQKGIKSDIVDSIFEEYTFEDEYDIAKKQFEKVYDKYHRKAKDKWDLKNKIRTYLYNRGFTSDVINEVLFLLED